MNKKVIIIIAVVLVAAAAAYFMFFSKTEETTAPASGATGSGAPGTTGPLASVNPTGPQPPIGVSGPTSGSPSPSVTGNQVDLSGGEPYNGPITSSWQSKNGLGTVGAVTYKDLGVQNPYSTGSLIKNTAHAGFIYNGKIYLKSKNSPGYKTLFVDFLITHNLPVPANI